MNTMAMQGQLAARIEAIERKHTTIGTKAARHEGTKLKAVLSLEEQEFQISNLKYQIPPACLTTGLEELDKALNGGLRPGLHEWYGAKTRHEEPDGQSAIGNRQFVPLCLLAHLAWRALEANPAWWVLWIGKKCFPYPAVLVRDAGRDLHLLRRSLFVRADAPADRVWAADLGVRCGLAGAVIADGTSLDMAATRRLQLSAKSRGAFIFLARPPQDLDKLSAAATRWMVTTSSKFKVQSSKTVDFVPSCLRAFVPAPQWSLELLRCKGVQPSTSRRVWLVEWNRAANVIRVSTPVCDCVEDQARRYGN